MKNRNEQITIQIPVQEWEALNNSILVMKDSMQLLVAEVKSLRKPEPDKMTAKEVMKILNRTHGSLWNYHEDGSLKKQYDEKGKLFYWRKDVERKLKELRKQPVAF